MEKRMFSIWVDNYSAEWREINAGSPKMRLMSGLTADQAYTFVSGIRKLDGDRFTVRNDEAGEWVVF